MKYILKKDLPFAKAGEEIIRDGKGIYIKLASGLNRFIDKAPFANSLFEETNRLIFEGWIEEVKPREFYIGLDDDGGMSFPYCNRDLPCDWDKIIRVREVIE